MRPKIARVLALTVLVFALASPVVTPANADEPHPQIRAALEQLRAAKQHMEHAAHDFGGHRVAAIKATDEAIHQLELCLQYDKK